MAVGLEITFDTTKNSIQDAHCFVEDMSSQMPRVLQKAASICVFRWHHAICASPFRVAVKYCHDDQLYSVDFALLIFMSNFYYVEVSQYFPVNMTVVSNESLNMLGYRKDCRKDLI